MDDDWYDTPEDEDPDPVPLSAKLLKILREIRDRVYVSSHVLRGHQVAYRLSIEYGGIVMDRPGVAYDCRVIGASAPPFPTGDTYSWYGQWQPPAEPPE